uniref:CCHC-type domain-containing protein n=1 Tax=Ditylenchus dipsaci TaxID=166011 RepID=A0A915EJB0_9BILA
MHQIASTNQLFNIVVSETFEALLSSSDRANSKGYHLYSDCVMPRVYAAVKKDVLNCLDACSALSFTSDVSSAPTESFINLTAQKIDWQWKRHNFVSQDGLVARVLLFPISPDPEIAVGCDKVLPADFYAELSERSNKFGDSATKNMAEKQDLRIIDFDSDTSSESEPEEFSSAEDTDQELEATNAGECQSPGNNAAQLAMDELHAEHPAKDLVQSENATCLQKLHKTHLAETESEMSGSSCSTTRGSSGRGRGGRGGFVPKKEVLEAMRARFSLSDETSKKTISEADISRVLEQSLNESAESSKDKKRDGSDIVDFSDDENIRGCDLCCDPDHRARYFAYFQQAKTVEPVIACYYCKKPGHIKSECPKKQRNDFNGSRNFGKNGQNQNRNFSENLTGSGSRYGAPSQNQRSTSWSVVQANSNFKSANFVNIPVPVGASVRPAIEPRATFLPSTDVVGKNPSPELPPKSKIVFNRSDSEDYESGDESDNAD